MFVVGDKVQTDFLIGIVEEVIDGQTRKLWKDTEYYRVRITHPPLDAGKRHIVRLDEVRITHDC